MMGMRRGSAHGLGPHTWRSVIWALAVALLATHGATSASAAEAETCSVTNTDSSQTYPRLQQAVDAAQPGGPAWTPPSPVPTTIRKGVVTWTQSGDAISDRGKSTLRDYHRAQEPRGQPVQGGPTVDTR